MRRVFLIIMLLPVIISEGIRCWLPWNDQRASLPGVGELRVCRAHAQVHFRPELDGADWHQVPVGDDVTLSAICQAPGPLEAMAALRAAGHG